MLGRVDSATYAHTIEGVEEAGLAQGVLSLGGRVTEVVTELGAADEALVGVDLVRLEAVSEYSTAIESDHAQSHPGTCSASPPKASPGRSTAPWRARPRRPRKGGAS